jgi:small subunit ribosomal protein S1
MDTDSVIAQGPGDAGEANEEPATPGTGQQDMDEYLTEEYNFQAPRRGDIRTGVIVEINEQGVIMDIGAKREGLVPAEDLNRIEEATRSELEVSARVRVFVLQTADKEGRPILSIHQARMLSDWIKAEEMLESGELYEGEVSGFNRGGVIVKFGKIRGFVPASQIAGIPRRLSQDERRRRLEAMIGQTVGLRIIEVDRQRRRLIFSHRRALRAWQETQRERVMETLVEKETRTGRVTSITDFGAFVDLGGADGLVHISELCWRRVEHPREIVKVGEEVEVYVLKVDHERKRIALSIKKLQPDPWTLVDDHYKIGQLATGRITRVLDFGAFVELDLGLEGLLHAREMLGTPELNPSEILHPGEMLPVKIMRIDSQRRRLDLSAKQVRQDEWERWVAEQQAAQESKKAEEAPPEAEAETAKDALPAEDEGVAPEAATEITEEALPEQAVDEPEPLPEPAEDTGADDEQAADTPAADGEETADEAAASDQAVDTEASDPE